MGTPPSAGDIYAFTPTAGEVALVQRGGNNSLDDLTAPGTDGTDMVWLESYGRSAFGQPLTKRQLWTAPFTFDPQSVAPRSLGAFPIDNESQVLVQGARVGCGRAAQQVREGFIRITNLADGSWWDITTSCENDADRYCINTPLVLTCDEMFAQYNQPSPNGGVGNNIVRLSFSALGPPNPALPAEPR